MIGSQQEFSETREVLLQCLFTKGNARQTQEIIFKVIQIPVDGLAIEARPRIADFVIQVATGFDLETGKNFENSAIGFYYRCSDIFAVPILREEIKECQIAQIFFKVCSLR